MNEYTEVSRLAITDIPKFILAVICSFASKLFSQENDTVAKAAEEVMQAYRDINTNIEELKRTGNDTAKDTTANSTLLFDKNVATDSSLSPIDKAVYSVLCALADNEALQCSPKVETIAAKASCSPRSVQTSLNTLEKRALIRRQPRFINHRQISSLYTVIGSKAASRSVNIPSRDEKNNTCEGSIQSNTSCAEEVSNTTEQNTTYFEGRKDEGCRGRNDCTQFSPQDLQSGTQALQTEKTLLESFKDSIRGASLPALAKKDLGTTSVTFPEEVTPIEETKDSLTGGALLPILECEKTENPEAPESIPSTSSETKETPFIRAESDGTTAADTDNAVCENPVIRAECDGTASTAYAPTPEQMSQLVRQAPAPNANGEVVIPEIPEWLLKRYEEARKRYAELNKDDQPKAAEAPKKAEEAPVIPGMPEPGTTEYYQRRLENTRNTFPELCQPVKQIVSVASQMADVLADIKKPKVDKSGKTAQAECETPVVKAEEKCDTPAPSDKPINAPEPVEEVKPAERSTADNVPAISDTPISPVKTPETAAKPVAPKNTAKGKRAVSRHPKELYSPSDAPEIMQATAEYFLYKTGRVALRWEEIAVLRKFAATQYPAVVQKEIVRACERFKKRKESLKCLTLMYVAVALEKRPTYGKKKELSEEKKKYFAQYEPEKKEYTAEELDAIQARIDEMQAKFNAEEEERRRRLQ